MSSSLKFRKKPVVIEAAYYDGDLVGRPVPEVGGRTVVVKNTCPDWFPAVSRIYDSEDEALRTPAGQSGRFGDQLYIGTLEGAIIASPGDWIVCGVKGEIYPVKPDVFTSTYDPV